MKAPAVARYSVRPGLADTSFQSSEMPMRATEIHTENRGVRPLGDASTRSPTIEAARSGVITSDNIRSARRGSGMTHSRYVETFEKRAISALRTGNGADALGAHAKVSFGAAATLRRRIPEGRSHQGFLFEPFQRRVKRSRRRVAACAGGDLLSYCCAIGAIVEAQDGEENDLLELSQAGDGRHLNYSVGKNRAAVNRPSSEALSATCHHLPVAGHETGAGAAG